MRKYAASQPAEGGSLVEVGKKKFKKAPRPSSSAVIDAADAAGPSAAPGSQGAQRSEIELVLLDPEVAMPDEFEPRLGLLSLGKVSVEGVQVVVSDDGIVTVLGASILPFSCRCPCNIADELHVAGSDGTLAASRLSFTSPFPVDTYSTLFFPPAPVDAPTLSLAPIKSVSLSTSSLTPSLSCLLALHSSFVVLASPRPTTSDSSAPTVSLTYWDARFGAVIASADLTVPSAVASSVSALSLSLSLPARHTAILTLSPAPSASGTRTALFGLPVASLPSASVLAAVVGKHSLSARFLAAPLAAAHSVVARAKATEPLRSQRAGQSDKKLALQEASRLAREQVLERLERVLAPLAAGAGAIAQDVAVVEAEKVWAKWLDEDKDRLWDYNKGKVRAAMDKEQERRMAAITDAGDDGDGDASRYKVAKRKIERAIAAAGASVKPGVDGGAADKKAAKASWKDVTAARIKGVSDRYRYMYHRERNKMEEAMGKTVKEFDWDEAVAKVERYEVCPSRSPSQLQRPFSMLTMPPTQPSLPSSFVTALLRLSFPVPLTSSTDLAISPSGVLAASETVWRHPTKIVGYLLRRELVGENQVEGGVTSFLARAADWVRRPLSPLPSPSPARSCPNSSSLAAQHHARAQDAPRHPRGDDRRPPRRRRARLAGRLVVRRHGHRGRLDGPPRARPRPRVLPRRPARRAEHAGDAPPRAQEAALGRRRPARPRAVRRMARGVAPRRAARGAARRRQGQEGQGQQGRHGRRVQARRRRVGAEPRAGASSSSLSLSSSRLSRVSC